MDAIERFIDGMTRSWWLIAAVFLWLGVVQSVMLDYLGTWIDKMRGKCSQCDRLRTIHIDATARYLDFCDQIGLPPEEVAKRRMPIYVLWAATGRDFEQHHDNHHRKS